MKYGLFNTEYGGIDCIRDSYEEVKELLDFIELDEAAIGNYEVVSIDEEFRRKWERLNLDEE